TMSKIEGDGTSITATIPDVTFNQYDDKNGYVDYKYTVKISDETEGVSDVLKLGDVNAACGGIRVVPNAPASEELPSVSHPFAERSNIQTYTVEDADYLKIVFDKASLLSEEKLHIIAEDGSYIEIEGNYATYHFMNNGVEQTSGVTDFATGKSFCFDGTSEHTLAIKGSTVTFLLYGNKKANSYGYGITSIDALTQEEIDNNGKGNITGDETPEPGDNPDDTNAPIEGDETAAPGSESAAPGSESAAPGSESAAPGSESAAPGSESAAPGSTTTPGGNGNNGNNGNSGTNGNNGTNAASGSVIIQQYYIINSSNAASGSGVTLTVDKSKVVVKQGNSMKVNFKSVNASGVAVKPSVLSSNEKVATAKVNSDTELEITVPASATKGASANITLVAGGKTAVIKVTVENLTKKLKAKKKKVTVKANKTAEVVFSIKAENKKKKTTDTLKASYKPKKIAKVTGKSITKNKVTLKVKGLKKGKTKMTITVGAKKAVVTVKVK
ncbi:MAG: hypothetical protein K6G11_06570, partial [Lachnospiraceae bacterium]|nr:hypothetical protein [Lachnospiraceae bacterium]